MGGEEFIILLPNTKKEDTQEITSRIQKSVSVHKFPEIGRPITVSIGAAGIPNPEIDNPEKLINISDLALYQAKTKGRNRVEVL